MFEKLFAVLVAAVAFVVMSVPASWLLMLFFGNIGLGWAFWDVLPLGIVVSALIAAGGSDLSKVYVMPVKSSEAGE